MPAWSKALLPLLLAMLILLLPVPAGLDPHAWRFFAIFVAVIAGLILEPLPGAVVGLSAVVLVAIAAPWVLFSPTQLAAPNFNSAGTAFRWAVAGFGNATVWLIFSAFMFAAGYEKTQFGKRLALLLVKKMGKNTLTLGYAISFADLLLAPFTPSNTARSGGTIFPIISNLPALYGSKPNDPSARLIGSYLMWVAIAATCVTSSMFLSALAPNLLATALVKSQLDISISWASWALAFLPVGVVLLLLTPLLAYWFYPPTIKSNAEVPRWAAAELTKLGPMQLKEWLLVSFVCLALVLWIFAGKYIEPALAALLVICLMLYTKVLDWSDITGNKAAWNTLVWFATLVTLAGGLSDVGFIRWLGVLGSQWLGDVSPVAATLILVVAFYLLHYLFASSTAHTTALLPVTLAIGAAIPGMNLLIFSLLLVTSLGLMGILTPYGTGPSPIYFGSGYLPAHDYWRLGTLFGLLYLAVLLLVGYPWLQFLF